jgi:DNA-binding NarL/FixJ family response regulator
VLMLMQEGLSIVAIAERLRLSESTVKTYASRIYGKLHVNNRSQALMTALSRGLLSVGAHAA